MTAIERKAIEDTIKALSLLLENDENYCWVMVNGKKVQVHRSLVFGDWEKTNITSLVAE